MRRALIAILLLLSTCAVVPAATPSKSIFIFHTDEFWLNLHHFLYVLGRAQNKTSDASREAVIGAPADQEKGLATLNASERNVRNEAVSAYAAGNSKKDLIFDKPLTELRGPAWSNGAQFHHACISVHSGRKRDTQYIFRPFPIGPAHTRLKLACSSCRVLTKGTAHRTAKP